MTPKNKLLFIIFLAVDVVVVALLVGLIIGPAIHARNLGVLNPQGAIAAAEKHLIVTAILIMLSLAIPVFIIIIYVVWRYRAGNKTEAKFAPDWDQNFYVSFVMWLLPSLVIFSLGVLIWKSTHALDPYKPIDFNVKPITIQVVALQWKWLFIYPQQNIATVNFIEFPVGTPVNFQLTADAPMNTFWIPELGGQVYAMAGMQNQLHLIANQIGEFNGSSAEMSGQGFAGMRFIAKAVSPADYEAWVSGTQNSKNILDVNSYNQLAQPSENIPPTLYALSDPSLFYQIIMKFMAPSLSASSTDESAPGNVPSSPGMGMPGMGE